MIDIRNVSSLTGDCPKEGACGGGYKDAREDLHCGLEEVGQVKKSGAAGAIENALSINACPIIVRIQLGSQTYSSHEHEEDVGGL